MSQSSALKVTDTAPILLRRATRKPQLPAGGRNNMTVCTTPGNRPEMHDQMPDDTAPRHDS